MEIFCHGGLLSSRWFLPHSQSASHGQVHFCMVCLEGPGFTVNMLKVLLRKEQKVSHPKISESYQWYNGLLCLVTSSHEKHSLGFFLNNARLDVWSLWNFLSGVNISSDFSGQLVWVKMLWSGWSTEREVFDHVKAKLMCQGATNFTRTQQSLYNLWYDQMILVFEHTFCLLNISAPVM